ncbi:AraC family transcriptional regulator [Sandaracinus amylolyticus]|uniref:Putative transcriptional regulator, AraC family n=1 Tax=Sandaracinus amylolyticus TaxID=927083 RepID=A0A0F6YLF4_9BACT|nr:helix-turn-helix transcriptional regulator [Sandaracinus amylolyticus]AKF08285.1 Putative transcriptional regulator, AraC family [Sandaracinus amylolyticus]
MPSAARTSDAHHFVGTPLIHTRSLDEAVQMQSSINSPVRVEPLRGRDPFEFRASRLQLGDVAIVMSGYRAEIRAHSAHVTQRFGLVVPVRKGGESQQSGTTAPLVPGRSGAIVSPNAPAGFTLGAGYRGIQLSIPLATLRASFEALAGASGRGAPCFEVAIDLTRGGGASVLRLLRSVLDDVRAGSSVLTAPPVAARLADTIVHAILLGLPHTESHLLVEPRRASEPALLRRAEEYLAANADRPVSSAELARAIGASGRVIAAAFRAHRDASPIAFHRQRRLELSRRLLLESPERSVTDVALACGFVHLGRFSVEYRARFGESPSDTRRRAASG